MMDSDLRRAMLTAASCGFVAAACICITVAGRLRGQQEVIVFASATLSLLFLLVFILTFVRCLRVRSMVGKAEISFVTLKDGEYKKEPPVVGKRPDR